MLDLKAVKPSVVVPIEVRTPAEIIDCIDAQGRIVAQALHRLSTLLKDEKQPTHGTGDVPTEAKPMQQAPPSELDE